VIGGGLGAPFHIGIATPDIDALESVMGTALGKTWVALPRTTPFHDTPNGPVRPSSRVCWSTSGPFYVELLRSEAGTVYRPELGTHLHHLGYWVDDVAGSVADAESEGWSLEVTTFDAAGRPSTFAYLSRPGDLWMELIAATQKPYLEGLLGG
jgi:hypothetical protein